MHYRIYHDAGLFVINVICTKTRTFQCLFSCSVYSYFSI